MLDSSDKFKFTPRTDILNKNETKRKRLKAISFPVVEKHANARNYLLDRKMPEFAMKDMWFVEKAQTLSLFITKIQR